MSRHKFTAMGNAIIIGGWLVLLLRDKIGGVKRIRITFLCPCMMTLLRTAQGPVLMLQVSCAAHPEP